MIKWLVRDWGLKLISLILAIGLWYYAVGEEGIEVNRTIPLEVVLKNEKMSILKVSTKALEVTLEAPRSLLADMASEKIRAVHEIGGEIKTAGEYTFRIEARHIKLPTPQIRIVRISPEMVRMTIDEVIVQKLEIKPNFVGEPAFGYKVSENEIEFNPNAVLLEGPKGSLEKLNFVKTEPIDLVGRVRSFRGTVGLDLPPGLKPLSEALIDAYIPVKEEFDEKSFEAIPVKVLNASEGSVRSEVHPQQISVILKGSRRKLDGMVQEGKPLLAYVDISSLDKGTHEVPVTVILPEDVTLKDPPVLVKVTIQK